MKLTERIFNVTLNQGALKKFRDIFIDACRRKKGGFKTLSIYLGQDQAGVHYRLQINGIVNSKKWEG